MTKNSDYRIDQVTTKTGDQGQTSVADGQRISKDCDLIQAIGDIDELNSSLGFLISTLNQTLSPYKKILFNIQNQLFNLGSELAIPPSSGFTAPFIINQSDISDLELEINLINQDLPPLTEFVLPGGTLTASAAHVSRSICRRAERSLVTLIKNQPSPSASLNQCLLIYLNRLSDFLFVLARALNLHADQAEIFWAPKNK